MIDLLFLQAVDFLQLLDLCDLLPDVVDLEEEVGQVLIEPIQLDLGCLFSQFAQGRESPLDGLDPHIVVHFLPHQGGLCEGLGLVTDGKCVQLLDVPQVVQHIRLVIAEVADRIFPEVWVIEGEHFEVGQPVQVQNFFEGADFVTADVEVSEAGEGVQAGLDGVDLVASDPQFPEVDKVVQVFKDVNFVIADPEDFEVGEAFEALDGLDGVMGEVEALEGSALLEPVDLGDFVFVKPQIFKSNGVLEPLRGGCCTSI